MVALHEGGLARRSDEERKAIQALVGQHIPREVAERLVDEFGTDPDKLKAVVWVEENLPRSASAVR